MDEAVKKTEAELPTVDSAGTPVLFVDGIHGMQFKDGVATINCTQAIFPTPNSGVDPFVNTVVRLVMPLPVFIRIADWFGETRDHLVESGIAQVQQEGDDGQRR